ncbi:MAG: RNA pseudouridine synthase [Patescibacteria group bacterium]|nr:RNA pseudouridine synthase [Patescibacteria group bacterium]
MFKINIISKNQDYVVINKPAGLLVHPAPHSQEKTLVDFLIQKYPQIKNVGDDEQRPGIVHRLDKEVSGLLVVTLNQTMFTNLKEQFQTHQILKEYQALVYGQVKDDQGIINLAIGRSTKNFGQMSVNTLKDLKPALTEYQVEQRFKNYTLLKVRIKTGRTHQIRLHLKELGYPIVGDSIYTFKKFKNKTDLNRIFLHSYHLGLNDLKNEWQEFKIDLPIELQDFLNIIK